MKEGGNSENKCVQQCKENTKTKKESEYSMGEREREIERSWECIWIGNKKYIIEVCQCSVFKKKINFALQHLYNR